MNLNAYFERIEYAGERDPTLQTLRDIVERHTRAIPFENLNPLLGWPVRLDIESLEQKLVRDRRGGFCFEQNLLLRHVLEALGFPVTGLGARILWNLPAGTITPRGHMLLRVDVAGEAHVVDVGFGGLTLTGALRLETDIEQVTPHEPFRLIGADGGYLMQAKIHGEWTALYRFDLQEQAQADYELTSWYLTHHPDSHFIGGLMAARPDSDRRYALRDNELTIHHSSGETERRILQNPAELREVLTDVFLLALPNVQELDAALERLTDRERLASPSRERPSDSRSVAPSAAARIVSTPVTRTAVLSPIA